MGVSEVIAGGEDMVGRETRVLLGTMRSDVGLSSNREATVQ